MGLCRQLLKKHSILFPPTRKKALLKIIDFSTIYIFKIEYNIIFIQPLNEKQAQDSPQFWTYRII